MTSPHALTHLETLEAEAIHILREAVAMASNPVMLFSAGKDSTVMAHLALRAFYPAPPPFPLLHIDSTWEFRELLDFRDHFVERFPFRLEVYHNEEGRQAGINPFDHGDAYTTIMRTDALKQALTRGGYDMIFGGARRDEERSRAKERVFSVRNVHHGWNPRQQRPELWSLYNGKINKGESIRVFPLSNWTELDIWTYALARRIDLCSLYFSRVRPVVERSCALVVVDDEQRMRLQPGERPRPCSVRFRTLGCWPVTAGVESPANDVGSIVLETLNAAASERQGRISDKEGAAGSLERQKVEGYF
jgi:sulfate adenylyltransferase subunit 2